MTFKVNYDHRFDSKGKDPDTHSPTLKAQHLFLWNKPLPDGTMFELKPEPKKYLILESMFGTFHLTSDSISHSLRGQKRLKWLIDQIPSKDLDEFQAVGSVIPVTISISKFHAASRFLK